MKRSLLLAALLLAGCANTQLAPTIEPAFVQILKRHGLTPDSTDKIDLVASQGGYGSGLQVTITEGYLIQEIWDTIYQSRPYRVSAASGNRRLRFYTSADSSKPGVEVKVNGTDRCHVKGGFEQGYRCPGINKVLEPLLKREYEKQKGGLAGR